VRFSDEICSFRIGSKIMVKYNIFLKYYNKMLIGVAVAVAAVVVVKAVLVVAEAAAEDITDNKVFNKINGTINIKITTIAAISYVYA
jgi:hypothetical protein